MMSFQILWKEIVQTVSMIWMSYEFNELIEIANTSFETYNFLGDK